MKVCIYLRKSRADEEAEKHGEGETLAKHRAALLKYAKAHGLIIVVILSEVASGESLMHRPQMLELLKRVELGEFDAVLVMDIDRLGRGNMQEQGLILETFRASNTKIMTLQRTYDLNNESDEFMTEVNSLFARRELRIITGRMQGGRRQSAESGNYIGTRPPYGYDIFKKDKERYLVPNPDQAPVVKQIFEWYTVHQMGSSKISSEMNKLGYKTYTGKPWEPSTVLNIIKNRVYIGRIEWGKKKSVKSTTPGKRRDTSTRPKSEVLDNKGKHEAIVDESVFQHAQEILREKYHIPYQIKDGVPIISNSLAGLIKCDMCGNTMVYRPYTKAAAHLMCTKQTCTNKSSQFALVESRLLNGLQDWLDGYKLKWVQNKKVKTTSSSVQFRKNAIIGLNKEFTELEHQLGNLHDLLERKVYTEAKFLERSNIVAERIEEIKFKIAAAEKELEFEIKSEKAMKNVIPIVENAINAYHRTSDPLEKNLLLKEVLHHAVYRKEKIQRGDQFTLILELKR